MKDDKPVGFYTPPPFKVCPECGGDGAVSSNALDFYDCSTCHGTGRIPIWYTVEQWEKLTGRKVPDDMPVWYIDEYDGRWYFSTLEHAQRDCFTVDNIKVIATEAGRPPHDWRPE